MALLSKWKWRILVEKESLWHNILKARYGDINLKVVDGGRINRGTSSKSAWWDDILSLQKVQPLNHFNLNCRIDIGKGFKTSFWSAHWNNACILKELFPILFSVSALQSAAVALIGGWQDDVWTWGDFGISCSNRDRPKVAVELLLLQQILQSVSPKIYNADHVLWRAEKNGSFLIKSCVSIVNGVHLFSGPMDRHDSSYKSIWKMIVPLKVKVFSWKCFLNILPTKVALSKRGIAFPINNACVFCNDHEESSIHSLLCCNSVDLVWKDVDEWIGFVEYKEEDFKKWDEGTGSSNVPSLRLIMNVGSTETRRVLENKFNNKILFRGLWMQWFIGVGPIQKLENI
ncbi:uncharacterized protein LOC131630925 [Vicia villosa]|uniref:uncharacterized protein LOC131630925 n=1 Tax=Vicia villosa TaxID=3911 RepID=UPI00273B6525|nr:uncharacterized protein LOC131630925 [Vicia villosa]